MNSMKRLSLVLLMIAAGVAGACDDDDPAGPTPVAAAFELEVDGAVVETATGPAWFGSDVNDDGDPVFVLLLGQDTTRHLVMVGKTGAARPAVGSYEIEHPATAGEAWTALHLITADDTLLGTFVADSGRVTITESTAAVLRGTLEFDGEGFYGVEEAEVQVTGTFVATPAPDLATVAASPARR